MSSTGGRSSSCDTFSGGTKHGLNSLHTGSSTSTRNEAGKFCAVQRRGGPGEGGSGGAPKYWTHTTDTPHNTPHNTLHHTTPHLTHHTTQHTTQHNNNHNHKTTQHTKQIWLEIVAGKGKKSEILGPPPFGAHTIRGPNHPSEPHFFSLRAATL